MLWLLVWLGLAAQAHARPSPAAAPSSTINSERPSNYTFHISIDRLDVQNVNFNVHLAVFLGSSGHQPEYQRPQEPHHVPGRPPAANVALDSEDYGRQAGPFVVAYPLPLWPAEGWKDSPPHLLQSSHSPRPEHRSVSLPQQLSHFSLPAEITTASPSPYPSFDTRSEELTTTSPQYPDHVTRLEKFITTSPPQYPESGNSLRDFRDVSDLVEARPSVGET